MEEAIEQTSDKNSYLGTEKLLKLMLKFSIPCVLSLVISALYNIVDQIFVGNSELSFLGNTATGVVFPIFIIAQAFAWWFGDGCAAYLNICQGQKNSQNAHKAIGTGIVFTLIASIVLMAIFYPLQKPILLKFGATEDAWKEKMVDGVMQQVFVPGSLDYATEYFNIILGFFPVFMVMNMMNAVIRADGSPGWSMASMLAGAGINIVLDGIFILVLHMGMAGAAWATIIGQCASFIISVLYFALKTKTFKMHLKSFIPNFKEFANPVKLGMSSFITQMTIVIISLVCNIMLGKYGYQSDYGANIPIAIIGIESKVFTVVINIVVGIVLGCQPIIGYNIGAKNYDRVKKLYLYILAATIAIGIIFTIIFETAPSAVVGIFGDPNTEQLGDATADLYWKFGVLTFRIFLMSITLTCTIKMSSIFFQASGKPVFAMISALVRDIVCFVPLICILPISLGVEGILWASSIADGIAIIVTIIFTVFFFKNLGKEKPEAVAVAEPTEPAPEEPVIEENNDIV